MCGSEIDNCGYRFRARMAVYDTIVSYVLKHQYTPSVREVCEILNINYPSVVRKYVNELIRDGLIETDTKSINNYSLSIRIKGFKIVNDN